MRISSRSLAFSCSSAPVLGMAFALGLLASAGVASAQPAAPQPQPQPQPPAAAPAAAPTDAPAKATDEPLVPPSQPAPAPAAAPKGQAAGGEGATAGTTVAAPDPDRDERALARQGSERPMPTGDVGVRPSDVFAEDWWSQARPSLELHGVYRVRAELFHKFDLGRRDPAGTALWPVPPDNAYNNTAGNQYSVRLCGDNPLQPTSCENRSQAGANMRLRLNPELHISDNLRILSQIDVFDNMVLGSTPGGYANQPAAGGGYTVAAPGGYTPLGTFADTAWAPTAGQNSLSNSIVVKRLWGEFTTPLGVLRFGRMPNQWGLGILNNEGNGYDSDYQSTVDRIMFVTGIKKYDLYFAGAWDFINEGPISAVLGQQQGQAYDLGQLDDVNQYVLMAVRRRDPELARQDLAKGLPVINGGVYLAYRNQVLANDGTDPTTSGSLGQTTSNVTAGYSRRGAQFFVPDLWLQFLYKKFRFEAEAAMVYGTVDNLQASGGTVVERNPTSDTDYGWKMQQFGLATQSEFRALDDKLRLDFGFGWASGDPDLASLTAPNNGMQRQVTNNRTYSEFRFHPDYRIDLILWRHILNRVQGAYYFRPAVQYDFARDPNGQRLGGSAAVIWSRASEFIQAPGHRRDLGVELDFTVYFQAKDGSLNDSPDKMGGFYTALQYGVLFPMAGLGYLPGQLDAYTKNPQNAASPTLDTETAQTLRWWVGILF